jgi:hypothetical protein
MIQAGLADPRMKIEIEVTARRKSQPKIVEQLQAPTDGDLAQEQAGR